MITSAAERPSSGWMSVGMPRPLSSTEMDSSGWMVTLMVSAWPASASSMALSSTSNTMWCRPVPSWVSPMYMPGRLRTASSPLRTLLLLESYSCSLMMWFSAVCAATAPAGCGGSVQAGAAPAGRGGLDAHRHHDVLEIRLLGQGEQRAAVGVAKRQLQLLHLQIGQHIGQVVDVKADFQRRALVGD